MTLPALLWFILRDAFWSGVAALGFATLFNVPVRTLGACALTGAAGHVMRTLLLEAGLSIEAATLAGATVVGLLGELFARHWHAPTPVFTVPGVIPLVPGAFAYRTMIGVLNLALRPDASATLLLETAVTAITTVLILGAIAFGIAAPSLLFRRHLPTG